MGSSSPITPNWAVIGDDKAPTGAVYKPILAQRCAGAHIISIARVGGEEFTDRQCTLFQGSRLTMLPHQGIEIDLLLRFMWEQSPVKPDRRETAFCNEPSDFLGYSVTLDDYERIRLNRDADKRSATRRRLSVRGKPRLHGCHTMLNCVRRSTADEPTYDAPKDTVYGGLR